MSLYASILAGGSGTRLWPLSTKTTPKQFLSLAGERTMIQQTVDRLLPLTPIDHMYIVTFENYSSLVREQLPDLPVEQIIAEPSGRGTAASIGLAATFIAARDPQAVMGSFTADHLITDGPAFRKALTFAEEVAREGYLVTLGIQPIEPETGFGYIQAGEELRRDPTQGMVAYRVRRFVEKPNRETAEQFIRRGDYAWNAGIFIWRVDRILEEIRRHVPTVGRVLDRVAAGISTGRVQEETHAAWSDLTENVTIDVGVMERAAADTAMVPVSIGWNDIGNWGQIAQLHSRDAEGNSQHMQELGRHVAVDTRNTFVQSTTGRVIATVGVEDLVVVDTPDAVLICHKDRVQGVKQITDQLSAPR